MYKALSLISGGLDSMLATKLILEQKIAVVGINFFTGFTGDSNYCFKQPKNQVRNAKWVCEKLGIKLYVVNVVDEFKDILLKPKYGYGANLNPCLDCKLFMIAQAKVWAEKNGFDFLITGEVIGQRPKSQRKDTLPLACQIADDKIVRPLSAKLLKPTLPEREGWIKRELLCDFSGRGRTRQIELAKKFGFYEFPQPAGGCALTDEGFCRRLQDLLDHRVNQNYSLDDVLLLRVGRHLRINRNLKIIIGRNETENNFIANYKDKYILLQALDYPGALVLLDGEINESDLTFACRLSAYFSKGKNNRLVEVVVNKNIDNKQIVKVSPLKMDEILQKWYV